MQRYPVRTSHRANLRPEALAEIVRAVFDTAELRDGVVQGHYGALQSLRVRAQGRELEVDVRMDPKVPAEVAAETVRRYNRFLEESTGYSAKERARRLRKSAAHAAEAE